MSCITTISGRIEDRLNSSEETKEGSDLLEQAGLPKAGVSYEVNSNMSDRTRLDWLRWMATRWALVYVIFLGLFRLLAVDALEGSPNRRSGTPCSCTWVYLLARCRNLGRVPRQPRRRRRINLEALQASQRASRLGRVRGDALRRGARQGALYSELRELSSKNAAGMAGHPCLAMSALSEGCPFSASLIGLLEFWRRLRSYDAVAVGGEVGLGSEMRTVVRAVRRLLALAVARRSVPRACALLVLGAALCSTAVPAAGEGVLRPGGVPLSAEKRLELAADPYVMRWWGWTAMPSSGPWPGLSSHGRAPE